MMLDLLVRGGTLADGRTDINIAVQGGRIVEMRPAIAASAVREIDASGHLVSASFVDAHLHLDATLTLGFEGRHDKPACQHGLAGAVRQLPKRRGLTRIPELMVAGCTVAAGHDSMLDRWYLSSQAGMRDCVRMVTEWSCQDHGP